MTSKSKHPESDIITKEQTEALSERKSDSGDSGKSCFSFLAKRKYSDHSFNPLMSSSSEGEEEDFRSEEDFELESSMDIQPLLRLEKAGHLSRFGCIDKSLIVRENPFLQDLSTPVADSEGVAKKTSPSTKSCCSVSTQANQLEQTD